MVYLSAIFFIVALIAGSIGFGGVDSATVDVAKVLFFVFLISFVITLVSAIVAGNKTRNALTGPQL